MSLGSSTRPRSLQLRDLPLRETAAKERQAEIVEPVEHGTAALNRAPALREGVGHFLELEQAVDLLDRARDSSNSSSPFRPPSSRRHRARSFRSSAERARRDGADGSISNQ